MVEKMDILVILVLQEKSNSMKTNWKSKNSKAKTPIEKWVSKIVCRTIDFPVINIGSSRWFQVGESTNFFSGQSTS